MPTIKAKVSQVLDEVRSQIARDARAVAGNSVLSKAEQKKLADGLVKEAAESLRAVAGSRGRVSTDALVEAATDRVASLLGQVNQRSGAGAAVVSKSEMEQLARLHSDAGMRVARAYEVITGKKIELPTDPVAPTVPPDPSVGPAAELAIVSATGTPDLGVSVAGRELTIKAQRAAAGSTPGGTMRVNVAGHSVTAVLKPNMGVRAAVEKLRAAAPGLDLAVTGGGKNEMTIKFYARGQAPKPAAPVYAHFSSPPDSTLGITGDDFVRRTHGLRSFELQATSWRPTDFVVMRVDNKEYTVPPGGTINSGNAAVYALKRQLEADGIRLDFVDYGGLFKFKLL